ncbi:hypothetical protein [Gracilibacillus halophilus]|uniref:hypothetical protein n=1 Tax=Gracilibacillus halophilus TaxID=470864 RepID=UPI0003A288F3
MLQRSIQDIKGIGSKLAESLTDLGIYTIEDLLLHFPNRYDHYEQKPIHELMHDEKVTIVAQVMQEPVVQYYGKKRSRLTVRLQVDGIAIKGIMFNRAFAKKYFHPGETVSVNGKWDQHRLQITIDQFQQGTMDQDTPITPIYPLTGDLKNYQLKKVMQSTIQSYADACEEILPSTYLHAYKLPNRSDAIKDIHFPRSFSTLKHAKRRFIYEEFLLFQLKMQLYRRQTREATSGNAQLYDKERLQTMIDELPFPLTEAQTRSLHEILTDMTSPYCMNRLLQGDVGSGKTAVAY